MTNTLPVTDRARTRRALVSFSTDVEDVRVLRVRFDRKHDDADRKAIIDALNAPELTQSTEDRVAELEAENARLRRALNDVAGSDGIGSAIIIARAALKGSSDGN